LGVTDSYEQTQTNYARVQSGFVTQVDFASQADKAYRNAIESMELV